MWSCLQVAGQPLHCWSYRQMLSSSPLTPHWHWNLVRFLEVHSSLPRSVGISKPFWQRRMAITVVRNRLLVVEWFPLDRGVLYRLTNKKANTNRSIDRLVLGSCEDCCFTLVSQSSTSIASRFLEDGTAM